MKKKRGYQIFIAVTVLLMAGFGIGVGIDWSQYNPLADSAPFSVFVLVRALEFVLPGLVSLCVALVLRKKFNKSSGRRG